MDRAHKQSIEKMVYFCFFQTSDSVIYTLLDCDHLLALLAPCRWASGIEANVRDIIEAGHVYVTDHYASLIASDGFLSLGQVRIADIIISVILLCTDCYLMLSRALFLSFSLFVVFFF